MQLESKTRGILSQNPWAEAFREDNVYYSIESLLLASAADLHDSPESLSPYTFEDYFQDYSSYDSAPAPAPFAREAKGSPGAPGVSGAPQAGVVNDSSGGPAPPAPGGDLQVCAP
jgi:hypothetical protein